MKITWKRLVFKIRIMDGDYMISKIIVHIGYDKEVK